MNYDIVQQGLFHPTTQGMTFCINYCAAIFIVEGWAALIVLQLKYMTTGNQV